MITVRLKADATTDHGDYALARLRFVLRFAATCRLAASAGFRRAGTARTFAGTARTLLAAFDGFGVGGLSSYP